MSGDGLVTADVRSRSDVFKRRGVLLAAAGLHGMGWWDGGVRVATERWLCGSSSSCRAGRRSAAPAVDLMLRVSAVFCRRPFHTKSVLVLIFCSVYSCFMSTTPKPSVTELPFTP